MTRPHTRPTTVSLWACLAALPLVFNASCGGRSALPQAAAVARDTSTTQRDSGVSSQPDAGTLNDTGLLNKDAATPLGDGLSSQTCIIAIRVDDCCTSPEPALASRLRDDPCLVPYPNVVVPPACRAQWPARCEVVDCAWRAAPSRLVALVPGIGCAWVSECASEADCVIAYDDRFCCPCPAAYPRSIFESDPCLYRPESSEPRRECPVACPHDPPLILCEMCLPMGVFGCVPSPSHPAIKACVPFPS